MHNLSVHRGCNVVFDSEEARRQATCLTLSSKRLTNSLCRAFSCPDAHASAHLDIPCIRMSEHSFAVSLPLKAQVPDYSAASAEGEEKPLSEVTVDLSFLRPMLMAARPVPGAVRKTPMRSANPWSLTRRFGQLPRATVGVLSLAPNCRPHARLCRLLSHRCPTAAAGSEAYHAVPRLHLGAPARRRTGRGRPPRRRRRRRGGGLALEPGGEQAGRRQHGGVADRRGARGRGRAVG